MKIFIFLAFFILVFSGCSASHNGSQTSPLSGDPALQAAASSILMSKCAVCHDQNGNDPNFLNTATDSSLDLLAQNSSYITQGNASNSTLYLRASDNSMPPGNPLSATDSNVIKNWINSFQSSEEPEGPALFSQVESQILQPKCYSCHENHSDPNLRFSDYFSVVTTIATAYDINSLILTATNNQSMPKNTTPLTLDEINLIESWVMDGTPNN